MRVSVFRQGNQSLNGMERGKSYPMFRILKVRPIPASVHLASLVSASNSSLLLFYTSMHQTLFPTKCTRPPPTLLKHIRTAPIRLTLSSAVSGPTHHSVMFWCTTPRIAAAEQDESMDEEKRKKENKEVLVVFQPVPNECPRLGVDPRMLKSKLSEGKRWEVGVWGPWSEVQLGVGRDDMLARWRESRVDEVEDRESGKDGEVGQDGEAGEDSRDGEDGQRGDERGDGHGKDDGGDMAQDGPIEKMKQQRRRGTKVLTVTRYLIAEGD